MREQGFPDITDEQLVAFRIHGVTPDFVKRMRAAGYTRITPDELVSLRIHGVDESFMRAMSGTGDGGAAKKK